jgi:hypothetical protein
MCSLGVKTFQFIQRILQKLLSIGLAFMNLCIIEFNFENTMSIILFYKNKIKNAISHQEIRFVFPLQLMDTSRTYEREHQLFFGCYDILISF